MAEQRQIPTGSPRTMVPQGAGAPGANAAIALTPKDIFGILRRHILLIISLTILGFMVGGVGWFLMLRYNPKYTARTLIKVLPPEEKHPTKIGGVSLNKDILYNHRVSLSSLIKQQGNLENLLGRAKIQDTEWFNSFGKIKDVKFQGAYEDLEKRFQASANRDAEYISLSMTCSSKKESAFIVNEMLDLFIASQTLITKDAVDEKLRVLKEQRDSIQAELDYSERLLNDIRTTSKIGDLEEHTYQHTITLRLNDLIDKQNQLILEMQSIQAVVETFERQAQGPVNDQVKSMIESDSLVISLGRDLSNLKMQLAGSLTKFGENHRKVRQIQELINNTEGERDNRKSEMAQINRQANLNNAKDRLTTLTGEFEQSEKMRQEAEASQRNLELARVQYTLQQEKRDERKTAFEEIKADIDTWTSMRNAPDTSKVQRIGYALEPRKVSSPKWQVYFPGGTFLGGLLGIGLAFLIELLNDLVRTPRDVGRYLHIPLLGVIPDADEDDQADGVDPCNVVRLAPYSITSESYRRLRTNLKLADSSESSRVLLVSSGMAGDGKTSVVVNLATTFVAENKKVLLVDANFWRPNLNKIFPNLQIEGEDVEGSDESEFGLSTFLTGLCGYKEVIRSAGVDGFDIIDSGPLPSNPAGLLGGEQMEQLIKHQRQYYDYIIIDGPPVLLVSDVKVLARIVDGTVLVFNATATRRGAALRTIRELREINAKIVGSVLVAVQTMKGGYFSEQFRSYEEYSKLQLANSV